MAQKKTVHFSARPTQDKTANGATGDVSDSTLLRGEFIPAASSVAQRGEGAGSSLGFGVIGRTVYGMVYALSFSCVLSTMMIGRLVPGRRVIAMGIGDGAEAAKHVAGLLDGRSEKIRAAFNEAALKA